MRSIIRCRTTASREEFQTLLSHARWLPSAAANEAAQRHKQQILDLVAIDDRPLASQTEWFPILSQSARKTWGLVSSPQAGLVEIRLKNTAAALREATELLVETVQNSPGGEAHPPGEKWALARQERRQEWKFAKWLLAAAIGCALLTIPPVADLLTAFLGYRWGGWLDGIVRRLATTFVVSSFVAGFAVFIHYGSLKRLGAGRWYLSEADMT